MNTLLRGVLMSAAILTVSLALGCGGSTTSAPQMPPPGGMPGGPMGMSGDPAMKTIMMRIGGRGPTESLSASLEKQLKTDPPAWDAIQNEAKEFVKLTDDLQKANAPAKGTKESWTKQTAGFHEAAVALDTAAKAKDLPAAKDAQAKLGNSCKECHSQHRGGPGGPPGGPGKPPMPQG